MVEFSNLHFADTLEVLFVLRDNHGCKTIQETYAVLQRTDVDTILEVLQAAYNAAHKDSRVSLDEFVVLLSENNVGFVRLTDVYQKVVEALMFNGMSPEEIAERKNFLASLQQK